MRSVTVPSKKGHPLHGTGLAHFIPTYTPWEARIALESLAKSLLNPLHMY
jgi:hypothetical protein